MGVAVQHFAVLPDPRAANVRYDLIEILFIAVAATLCGVRSCTDGPNARPSHAGLVENAAAAAFLETVRSHWEIGNGLH